MVRDRASSPCHTPVAKRKGTGLRIRSSGGSIPPGGSMGRHVPRPGDGVLQALCGRFDSDSFQYPIPGRLTGKTAACYAAKWCSSHRWGVNISSARIDGVVKSGIHTCLRSRRAQAYVGSSPTLPTTTRVRSMVEQLTVNQWRETHWGFKSLTRDHRGVSPSGRAAASYAVSAAVRVRPPRPKRRGVMGTHSSRAGGSSVRF